MHALIEKRNCLLHELEEVERLIERQRAASIYSRQLRNERKFTDSIDELAQSDESPVIGGVASVNDREDQVRILRDIHSSGINISKISSLGSLLSHADNVHYLYHPEELDVPTWFREKYSQHFIQ